MVRRRTAAATQTAKGGPPPRLVIAPHRLCPLMVLALRSTRRPLSNHPNEPLGPVKAIGTLEYWKGAPLPQGSVGASDSRLNP